MWRSLPLLALKPVEGLRQIPPTTLRPCTPSSCSLSSSGPSPRTHLPFLQQIVRKAIKEENVAAAASPRTPLLLSPKLVALSSHLRIPKEAFTPYPLTSSSGSEKGSTTILYRDQTCVLVRDAYPKSSVHCLVMPLDLSLVSLSDLRYKEFGEAGAFRKKRKNEPTPRAPSSSLGRHAELLAHMHWVGQSYQRYLAEENPSLFGRLTFKIGFHSVPSLPQLHMHLISTDFSSACLKHKKHYNSFTTPFFLPVETVLEDLKQNGKVTLHADVQRMTKFELQPMQCLWCGCGLKDMPTMKSHVPACFARHSSMPTKKE